MLKERIDARFEEQVQSIKELVAIPSVSRGEPLPGKPLGAHVHDALTYSLELANKLGFDNTRSLDGYCGIVDYGEGDETLLIMVHIDVVPAGPAWTSDPFAPIVRDGRMIGRGVVDDKGPAVCALYALAAIKDEGIPLRRRVRILFGCDEEVDWACIKRYKETEPEPTLAFTPDADYPVVNAEKNLCHTTYVKKWTGSGVRINCGVAPNVVPGEASATLPFTAEPVAAKKDGVVLSGSGNELRATGRGGHAAEPQLAHNALLALLGALCEQPLEGEDFATATALHALLSNDLHGEGFGLDREDASGRLTLSTDILRWDDTGVSITLDCRCPLSISQEELLAALDAPFAAIGFTRTYVKYNKGHLIPADSELVRGLLSVYEKNVGHRAEPLAIGGGTYARAFENAVAFGIQREGADSECHMPDESGSVEEMRSNTVMIAEAIVALAGK